MMSSVSPGRGGGGGGGGEWRAGQRDRLPTGRQRSQHWRRGGCARAHSTTKNGIDPRGSLAATSTHSKFVFSRNRPGGARSPDRFPCARRSRAGGRLEDLVLRVAGTLDRSAPRRATTASKINARAACYEPPAERGSGRHHMCGSSLVRWRGDY